MKNADITFDKNIFSLSGELDFANVMLVYKKSLLLWKQVNGDITFDFSKLTSCNSAGLALVIEWVKLAKRNRVNIHFKNLSQELLSIAKAAGLDKVIG